MTTAAEPNYEPSDDARPLPGGGFDVGDATRFGGGYGTFADLPRREQRLRLAVTTHGPGRAPMQLQVSGGYLLPAGTTTPIEVYGSELPALQAMVSDEAEEQRIAQAKETFAREFFDDDVRAALVSQGVQDDAEREVVQRATVSELRAMVGNAAPGTPIALAYKHAQASTPRSWQGVFHRMYASERHTIRPVKSVEVIGDPLPAPGLFYQSQAARPGDSAAIAAVLERIEKRAAEDRLQFAQLITAALEKLTAKGAK